jgi:integrase
LWRSPRRSLRSTRLSAPTAATPHSSRCSSTTGARLGELAGLHVDHLDLEIGVDLVMGKGRRTSCATPFAAGGNESHLVRLAGWRSRDRVSRYAASASDDRTREVHGD